VTTSDDNTRESSVRDTGGFSVLSGNFSVNIKTFQNSQVGWFTPVILATQKAEIRRIAVGSQPPADSLQDPIWKKTLHKIQLLEEALSSNLSTAKKNKKSYLRMGANLQKKTKC
jgi:hypothetical protein